MKEMLRRVPDCWILFPFPSRPASFAWKKQLLFLLVASVRFAVDVSHAEPAARREIAQELSATRRNDRRVSSRMFHRSVRKKNLSPAKGRWPRLRLTGSSYRSC